MPRSVAPPRIDTGGRPSRVSILAPISRRGFAARSIGRFVSDASPRSLLVRLFRRQTLDAEAREVLRRYSPLYRAHDAMPPMLLINGTGERLWTQAQAFARKLTDVGVPHEVVALEGAPHGLENWEGHAERTGYKSRMLNWIQALAR